MSKQGACIIEIYEEQCVLSYGFDFRPKYRDILSIRKIIPGRIGLHNCNKHKVF